MGTTFRWNRGLSQASAGLNLIPSTSRADFPPSTRQQPLPKSEAEIAQQLSVEAAEDVSNWRQRLAKLGNRIVPN